MILLKGHTYDFRYENFHVDPSPHLYVTYADHDYTKGFNIHYMPMARLGLEIKNYRKIHPRVWKFMYEGMLKDSYYREIFEIMQKVSDNATTMMKIFRTYHTRYLTEVKMITKGVA
jgi:hypothetical protein